MPDHFYELATARFVMRNCRFLSATQDQQKALEFMNKFLAKEEKMNRGAKDRITQLMRQLKHDNER